MSRPGEIAGDKLRAIVALIRRIDEAIGPAAFVALVKRIDDATGVRHPVVGKEIECFEAERGCESKKT